MTILALTMQKTYLNQQKTQLEFQEMVANNNYNYVTTQLTNLASDDDVDMESAAVRQLEYYQELYDSEKESIESQLKVINSELDGYTKAIDTNIKSDCKLNISV